MRDGRVTAARIPTLSRGARADAIRRIGVPGEEQAAVSGLYSTVNPCPLVAGSYQFPENAKSALDGRALVVEHVTFWVMRVSGMVPVRPEPSVKCVSQRAAGARIEAQRRRADRNPVGGRRRIEVAAGVLIDRERCGLSARHLAAQHVPALAIRATGDGVVREPAHEDRRDSGRHDIGIHLDFDALSIRWPACTTNRSGPADSCRARARARYRAKL